MSANASRGHRGTAALERNVHQIDARHQLEHLAGKMHRRAVAARSVGELSRILLRKIYQLGSRLLWKSIFGNQEKRRGADHRDRREILRRVVGRPVREVHGDRERARGGEHDGVAVGRRLQRGVDADGAAGARPVVDDHRLPEALAKARREDARDGVGAAARRKGDDETHGLGGIRLRQRRQWEGQREQNQEQLHFHTPRFLSSDLSTLPSEFLGSESTNTTWRGFL
jgi:hypothetical protein